ncbi:MAG TPA: hypothetical protein VEC93_15355, partial [Anaerolineae bacterium]|nr:hypothetical protein [Anaerolineae bacterium]
MPQKNLKRVGQVGIISLLPILVLIGVLLVRNDFSSAPVQAAGISADLVERGQPASIPPRQGDACYCGSDIYNCNNFRD